jgi:outer membrane protein assembly factor BamB
VLLAALAASAGLQLPAQWHVAVGGSPRRDGTAAAATLGPGTPQVAWRGGGGAVVAQQAALGEGLCVAARIRNFDVPTGTDLVALDLLTGAQRWSVQLPMTFPDSWRTRLTGIRDGQVYATRSGNTNADYLYALRPSDGSVLWRSQGLITETSTESIAYASNGDPITSGKNAAGQATLMRISRATGLTVWEVLRSCPTSGGCDAAVHGERAYMFEAGVQGPVITAVDVAAGQRLYSSPGLGGGFIQQVAPFVGPDGTVYAPRTQNNPATDFLFALDDTGSGLTVRWQHPIGYVPFASHAVGPDGSVYGYGRDLRLIRLDPATGTLRSQSFPIPHDSPAQPRLAVDADGTLFLTNGSFAQGELFAFTPDLRLIWRQRIANVNVGGPALAAGTLVVCGVADVVAYRTPCPAYFATYGSGCPGTGGLTPSLTGDGCPTPGALVTLRVRNGLGGAPGFLLLGGGPGAIPLLPQCELSTAPLLGLIAIALAGSGAGQGFTDLPFVLPAGLPPLDVFFQTAFVDAGGAGGAAASNALQMHVR